MVVQAATIGLWKRIQYLTNCDPSYERLWKTAADPHSDLSESHGVVIDSSGRIHVPANEELRIFLISENHDVPLGDHFGAERTLDLVQRHWTWTGIARDIREYVRLCHECQWQKHLNTTPAGLLHPYRSEETLATHYPRLSRRTPAFRKRSPHSSPRHGETSFQSMSVSNRARPRSTHDKRPRYSRSESLQNTECPKSSSPIVAPSSHPKYRNIS